MSQILCRVSEIGSNGKEIVLRHGPMPVYVMLFRQQDAVRAYLNVCPHQGRQLNLAPDRFLFTPGGSLMCPHHGACFRIEDGECLEGPCKGSRLRSVPVLLVDDEVRLEAAVDELIT